MIMTKTPFRISFFGGGTDHPEWSKEHGGKVLATTFDKYCYITVRVLPPFFEHSHRIVYSRIESVSDINLIEHRELKDEAEAKEAVAKSMLLALPKERKLQKNND